MICPGLRCNQTGYMKLIEKPNNPQNKGFSRDCYIQCSNCNKMFKFKTVHENINIQMLVASKLGPVTVSYEYKVLIFT